MAKNLALGPILAHLAQIQVIKFFVSKIWLCQLQDVMVSYQSCRISIKTNDPILRKEGWRDGGTEGGTGGTEGGIEDRQMDKSDFIRCCPT